MTLNLAWYMAWHGMVVVLDTASKPIDFGLKTSGFRVRIRLPPRNMLLLHPCYRAKIGHSNSNRLSVILEIARKF